MRVKIIIIMKHQLISGENLKLAKLLYLLPSVSKHLWSFYTGQALWDMLKILEEMRTGPSPRNNLISQSSLGTF